MQSFPRKCFLSPDQIFDNFDKACFLVSESKSNELLIWGDSYAAHLYAGIVAQPWAKNYSVAQLTVSGCRPTASEIISVARPNCKNIQKDIAAYVSKRKPSIVLLAASWRDFPADILNSMIQNMLKSGVDKVVVVGPTSYWPHTLPDIYFKEQLLSDSNANYSKIPKKYAESLISTDLEYRAVLSPNAVKYISLYEKMCKFGKCLMLVPDSNREALMQFDGEHLTLEGSSWIAAQVIGPALGESIQPRPVILPARLLAFSAGGEGVSYLGFGWHPPEAWGSWTAFRNKAATLKFPVDAASPPRGMKIKFRGQLGPGLTSERFYFELNGVQQANTLVSDLQPSGELSLHFEPAVLEKMRSSGRLEMKILSPDSKSPSKMGLNNDQRILGFGLDSITFIP